MIASRPFSCSANGFLLFLIILCNNRSIFCRIQPRLGFNFFKRKPSTVDGCALRYVCIWRVPITAYLCQIRRHDTCQVIDTKFSVSLYHYVPRISFQIEKLRKFCLEKKIQRVDRSKYSPLLSVSLSRSSNGWIPARKNVASLDKIQSSVGPTKEDVPWNRRVTALGRHCFYDERRHTDLGWDVLQQSAYSLDVTPSDYHVFRSMQHALSDTHLQLTDDILKRFDDRISSKDAASCRDGIHRSRHKWLTVVESFDSTACDISLLDRLWVSLKNSNYSLVRLIQSSCY